MHALLALCAALVLVAPSRAEAGSPYLVIPSPHEVEKTPAYRYANMTDEEAFAELNRRRILYVKLGKTGSVRAPIRLVGRLHGVYFHSSLPPEERATSMFEILDARLALALDDFAEVLEKHEIDEVLHYTMYRPNVAPPHLKGDAKGDKKANEKKAGTPKANKKAGKPEPKKATPPKRKRNKAKKPAKRRRGAWLEDAEGDLDESFAADTLAKKGSDKKAANPKRRRHKSTGKTPAKGSNKPEGAHAHRHSSSKRAGPPPKNPAWAPPGTRHPGGLAIDVGGLKKKDGTWLSVANDFQGKVGSQTCGAGAPQVKSAKARELREIACECLEAGVFTYVLTPNFDAAHVDHYHMEIKPGVKWFLYH